ncbi:hypothetical protein KJ780_04820 [Candidatus Micrarchaeota archaeon]|nr:hypothetical protein [Candidatus Micrarchaeota archaeon]
MVSGSGMAFEEKKKTAEYGIFRVEEYADKESTLILDAVIRALREPSSQSSQKNLENRLRRITESKDNNVIERVLKEAQKSEKLMGEEKEAILKYSKNKEKDFSENIMELQTDVKNSAEAFKKIDEAVSHNVVNEKALANAIALTNKKVATKDDVFQALAKSKDAELVDALYTIISKQESASIAARNIIQMDKIDYEKLFGIARRNAAFTLLAFYRRILGDAGFHKAKLAIMQGRISEALSILMRSSVVAQYLFFALVAPSLIRSGMWNNSVLGIIGKALGIIKERGGGQEKESEYLSGVAEIAKRFGDFKGLNLSAYSAAFLGTIKEA